MRIWNDGYMDTGWGLVMMIGMLAFWVLIAVMVVWLLRAAEHPQGPGAQQPGGPTATAEQILAERLARGEIDAEDYRARLTAITRSG